GRLEERYPSRSAWLQALSNSGYTEESYTTTVRLDLLSKALKDAVITAPELTEEQIQQYTVMVAPTLAGRRSSHILFSNDDFETAVDVYQRLLDGADFAEMAREYSIDGTGANGGDVGWDSVGNFVSDYESALRKLEPGEMSPVVKSQFGYHIILCTEKYEPTYLDDGTIDLSSIPDDLMDIIKASMSESLEDQMFNTYLSNLEATATLAAFDENGNQVSPDELGLSTEEIPLNGDTSSDEAIDDVIDPNVDNDVDSVVSTSKGAVSLAG
ncbi:MAG: peptidylprolyl isomerase, partial [Coriobacteriia bacterium]|nr:peptidylprolyl isomerase [Coriobacteriia bacterium]